MNSYYNLFVGTENGLLKGVNTNSKLFNNLNNLDNLTREKEIACMSWSDKTEQDEVCFLTRDQHLVRYKTNHEISAPFEDLGQIDAGKGIVKAFEFLSEKKYYTCVESGALKLWSIESDDENGGFSSKVESEINVSSLISCAKMSPFDQKDSGSSLLVATGGKENDLKIWDVNSLSTKKEPVFRAKNLADNWIQLREPVWVMCVDFLDPSRVVVGTAYNQIRVYDLKSGVRRPVLNLKFGNCPVTSISVLPDQSNRLIAGNTRGEMELIDIRSGDAKGQCKTLKKYKGFQGTIKSLQISQLADSKNGLSVATCGLDRFLRVHHVETGQLASKVYLKSRLNCLLFSKHQPLKMPNEKDKRRDVDEDQWSNINSEDLGTDDLWSDMEQIVDEHPEVLASKRKVKERLGEFESEGEESDEDEEEEEEDKVFKKPK